MGLWSSLVHQHPLCKKLMNQIAPIFHSRIYRQMRTLLLLCAALLVPTIECNILRRQQACVANNQVCQENSCSSVCCSGCAEYYTSTFVWLCRPCDKESPTQEESVEILDAQVEITKAPKQPVEAVQTSATTESGSPIALLLIVSISLVGVVVVSVVLYRKRRERLLFEADFDHSDRKSSIVRYRVSSAAESVSGDTRYSIAPSETPSSVMDFRTSDDVELTETLDTLESDFGIQQRESTQVIETIDRDSDAERSDVSSTMNFRVDRSTAESYYVAVNLDALPNDPSLSIYFKSIDPPQEEEIVEKSTIRDTDSTVSACRGSTTSVVVSG